MPPKRKAKTRSKAKAEMITVCGDIVQETDDAILLTIGQEEYWLPKSQVEYDGERGDIAVDVLVPEWLAEEKGLADGQGASSEPVALTAASAAEVVADVMEGLEASDPPATFTFVADVEHVYATKYVLLVTNEQGGTASLEFDKADVRYEGSETIDLQPGYLGVELTVPWALAVEKHLPEFLAQVGEPAPAGDDADSEDAPSGSRPYHHKLRTETVTKDVALTDAEKIAYGKNLVEHLEKEAEYKGTASHYGTLARSERKRADKVIDILKVGREERSITCDVVADYNAGQLVHVESEWPHREVQRRPLTDKDRQLPLFDLSATSAVQPQADETPDDTAQSDPPGEDDSGLVDVDADAEAEQERSCGTCVHVHATHEDDESSPCADCGQNQALPNWTGEYHVPHGAGEQGQTVAAVQ